MTTKDEALALALEALKQIDEAMPFPVAKLAQKAIREALAQPAGEKQEPVAYRKDMPVSGAILGVEIAKAKEDQRIYGVGFTVNGWHVPADLVESFGMAKEAPQPAAQPSEWVGLSDEEANELWESTDSDWELMKRTESKLREKNARKDIPAADKAGGDEPVVLAGLTKDEIWTQCCAEWRGKCDTDTACYTRHQPQGGE